MNKRRIILGAIALILVFAIILPGVIYRVQFEQTTKVYTAAVDVSRLAKFFNILQMPEVLDDYKEAGATTAVIMETKGLYNEEHLKAANDAGFNIALVPDITVSDDAQIARICNEYNVKYIKLQLSIWKDKKEAPKKPDIICDVIKEHGLTLVLTETIYQLGNDELKYHDQYMAAANGNVLRTFNSYNITNVDKMDYPASYYQMYNSAYDRNTRFITVKQLDDDGFTSAENAARTQECVRLFCQKMESHGFVSEGTVDYNIYKPARTLISAALAAISVLMLAIMVDILYKKNIPYLTVISLAVAAAAFGITFIMPTALILLYPTLFATLAPCFCIAVIAKYIYAARKRLGLLLLLLTTVCITVILFVLCGGVLVAALSGPDYFLNEITFRGVKLSLVAPILFTGLLLIMSVYKKRTLADYKKIVMDALKMIRWYHIALFAVVAVVAAIYVIRSGNVNKISFTEAYLRNLLTEYFTARPRTKEILLGWPCFIMFIYFAKKDRFPLLQWIFAIGGSILFASSINTFCHVFTLAETMFARISTGLLFGGIISIILLGVLALIFRIFKTSKIG